MFFRCFGYKKPYGLLLCEKNNSPNWLTNILKFIVQHARFGTPHPLSPISHFDYQIIVIRRRHRADVYFLVVLRVKKKNAYVKHTLYNTYYTVLFRCTVLDVASK